MHAIVHFTLLSKRTKFSAKESVNWAEEKETTRCYLLFYCTSYRLNMFRALLCLSSGVHDYNVDYHIGHFVFGLL